MHWTACSGGTGDTVILSDPHRPRFLIESAVPVPTDSYVHDETLGGPNPMDLVCRARGTHTLQILDMLARRALPQLGDHQRLRGVIMTNGAPAAALLQRIGEMIAPQYR